ncbi:MAG: helix-turn-helix domain-containing protein [Prevotellaceae bacterium]|jgi:AraC-like DNA-binding protein|nr:helix-turn-helix domain-containing protein [Prevotellaceae bacterium]
MENDINLLKTKLSVGVFSIIIAFFVIVDIYFFTQYLKFLGLLLILLIVIMVLWAILIHRHSIVTANMVRGIFIPLIVIFASVFIYFFHQEVPLWIYYGVLTLSVMVFISKKASFITSIACTGAYIIILLLCHFLPEDSITLTEEQKEWLRSITIAIHFLLFVYLFYCEWRIEKLREGKNEGFLSEEEKKQEIEKYNLLYNQIVRCFEKDEIYKRPDLTMAELAETMGTNITYVYRALKHQGINDNFSSYVNKYRIKAFKNEVKRKDYERFTISYMFENCGFKHQSSFNKIFKRFEGVTPSEYIAMHKAKIKKQ